MALTEERWQESVALVPPAPEPKTPLQERIAVIETLSHTDCENLLVAIARDDPEAFDRGRFAAL